MKGFIKGDNLITLGLFGMVYQINRHTTVSYELIYFKFISTYPFQVKKKALSCS